jgi:hypothetical protein
MLERLVDRLEPAYVAARKSLEHRYSEVVAENSALRKRAVAAEEESRIRMEPPHLWAGSLWTAENAASLRAFLASDDGVALSKRLQSMVVAAAVAGAKNTANTIHAAGMSAGWDEAVRYLHSLSRVSGAQDTKQTDERPRGETDLLEQLSP